MKSFDLDMLHQINSFVKIEMRKFSMDDTIKIPTHIKF